MSQAAQNISFRTSPDRKPFEFHSWLELPFPVVIDVDECYEVSYRGDRSTTLRIRVDSKAYRVSTGSLWLWKQESLSWAKRRQAGEQLPAPAPHWLPEYASEGQVQALVTRLRGQEGTPYVHVEEIPAVVHLSALVPDSLVPDEPFLPNDLAPSTDFLTREAFPKLQIILDAYRVAAKPWMRYSILPLSEALVDRTIIQFTDADGESIGSVDYGFDVKSSPWGTISRTKFPIAQARFDGFLRDRLAWQDEDHFASSYYLYRMRRWNEAMVIASSVVDRLLEEVIRKLDPSKLVLKSYNPHKWKDLFNKTLPGFGTPKLADEHQALWEDFCKAKKHRGSAAHGKHSDSYDRTLAKDVARDLRAFYNVAQWLCQQLGNTWALDVFDGAESLDPFPLT